MRQDQKELVDTLINLEENSLKLNKKTPYVQNSFSEKETRKPMKMSDFKKLLIYIDENHSFSKLKGLKIKYVMPVIDMRSSDIHSITFRGLFGEKVFSITNENKDRSLEKMIHQWLESKI